MRVLIVTDLEGVNWVLNFSDWCTPEGLRNEAGCRFLTEEVNAAVKGFFNAGATEVIVADGRGNGGVEYNFVLLKTGKDKLTVQSMGHRNNKIDEFTIDPDGKVTDLMKVAGFPAEN